MNLLNVSAVLYFILIRDVLCTCSLQIYNQHSTKRTVGETRLLGFYFYFYFFFQMKINRICSTFYSFSFLLYTLG